METSASIRISDQEYLIFSDFNIISEENTAEIDISFRSGNFACLNRKFTCSDFSTFLTNLKKAQGNLEGIVVLSYRMETERISLEYAKNGRVIVRGVFVDYGWNEKSCDLTFECDQTFIPRFIKSLETKLKANKAGERNSEIAPLTRHPSL